MYDLQLVFTFYNYLFYFLKFVVLKNQQPYLKDN